MRDFNTVKADLIRHLNLSCQKTDGEILWYEGTIDVLVEFLSICNPPDAAAGTANAEEGNMMEEEVVFIKQKALGELIFQNLFSEETEKFYNNCAFASDRMAFMQGMNYAALLCNVKLEQYPAIIRHELPLM